MKNLGQALGKGLLFVLETAGDAIIEAQKENAKQRDQLVELKNKEIERELNQHRIIKGDIDNLRNHVARIVAKEDTPQEVKDEGKRLLKRESTYFFGEDTYTCDKYYEFVIEHGL